MDNDAERYAGRPRPGGRRALVVLIAVGAVAVAVAAFVLWRPEPVIDGVQTFDIEDASHTTENVNYRQTPPVGGPHSPVAQRCGFYSAPVPDERAVHSLENGAVWVTYRPGLDDREMDVLRALAMRREVLVSAYPGLTKPVVASAWGAQLALDSPSDPRLVRFIAIYVNAPEAPKAQTGCDTGEGTPE